MVFTWYVPYSPLSERMDIMIKSGLESVRTLCLTVVWYWTWFQPIWGPCKLPFLTVWLLEFCHSPVLLETSVSTIRSPHSRFTYVWRVTWNCILSARLTYYCGKTALVGPTLRTMNLLDWAVWGSDGTSWFCLQRDLVPGMSLRGLWTA